MKTLRRLCLPLLLIFCLFFVFPQAASAQETYVGVWNGFLDHVQVAEVNNLGGQAVKVRFEVLNLDGNSLGAVEHDIAAKGSFHFLINEFAGTKDSYGVYLVTPASGQANLNLTGMTAFYRFPAVGTPKPVEYAFAIPFFRPVSGTVAGIYNSFNPDPFLFSLEQPVFNWLSIYLPPTATKSLDATIEVYENGQLFPERGFQISLQPGQRVDRPLGHEQGQVTGVYRIVPSDNSVEFGAFLNRYNQSGPSDFRFAFSLAALEGSCDPGPVPASTMNPATNWGEVANVSSTSANVSLREL